MSVQQRVRANSAARRALPDRVGIVAVVGGALGAEERRRQHQPLECGGRAHRGEACLERRPEQEALRAVVGGREGGRGREPEVAQVQTVQAHNIRRFEATL